MFYPCFVLAFMNFCERIYWNIRLSLTKDFLFIDGYAAINKNSYKSKEEVIKHFFRCKDSHNNGLNPPCDLFFKEGYLAEYPDVANVGVDPWVHFVLYGKQEGRDNGLNPPCELFFKEGYLAEYPDVAEGGMDPWEHFVLYGKYENKDNGHNPGLDLFNKEIYLKLYKDVCDSASDPWYHYIMYGKNEGRYSGVFCNMITKIVSSAFSTN